MKRGCAIAVMICGLITSVSAASAADLIVQEPVFEPLPQPALAGWYLRGDIGYNLKSKTGGKWDFWNQFEEPYRGVDDTFNYDDFSLKGGASYGVGVGYRFNDMLRTDLTLDYFRASINGRTNCPSYVKSSHGLNPVEDNCHYEDNSKASVWTAMANAYVDLPRVGPLTPYLGAGIGAAYVKYDTWKTSEICPTCTLQSDKDGFDSWRFAMALMAGVSYDLTDQLKLDLGYRYLRVNGGNAYGYDEQDRQVINQYGQGAGADGPQAKDNGFNIHTVRAGLRYEFR
ncbi:outer surface protein [Brucella neotomae]|uniref:outer membrane protein n=1 Tax=Brucella neotomae TaxID=29460 RepID=UPI000D881C7A|nr:outer membrane protein [Brucella neotomae]SPU69145.1 outer surface protein [Brucella neotomae]SPU71109.1 outer surface protein [Brucella neotomae]